MIIFRWTPAMQIILNNKFKFINDILLDCLYLKICVRLQKRKITVKIAMNRKESNHIWFFFDWNQRRAAWTETETEELKAESRRYFTRTS